MSSYDRDESLFADSTMSFGEHIEELRGSLARALVGLAIGVGIAFFYADEAVQWIEKPLKDGLVQYYVAKATLNFQDELTPEQLSLITDRRMAPSEMYLEVQSVLSELRTVYRDKIPQIDHQYEFTPTELAATMPEFCAAITGKPKADSFHELVVEQLSDEQRQQFVKLTKSAKPSDAELGSATQLLNQLLTKSELTASVTEGMVNGVFPAAEQRQAIESLLEQAKSDAALAPRINRLMLVAAFSPHLPPQRPSFLRLITWKPVESSIQTLKSEEAFMTWFKAAFVLGALLSAPWVFFQLWTFVAAGLYPHEKKYVYTYLPFSLTLFFAGAAMAFFFVFPFVLKFLFSFNLKIGTDIIPRLNDWLGFALFLPLGFGISFQLPLVMLMLERIGIVSVGVYVSKWRIAVLVIAVISMLLTPADPSSMLLMGIPLTVLYFGGIALCKWMPKRQSPHGEGYDP